LCFVQFIAVTKLSVSLCVFVRRFTCMRRLRYNVMTRLIANLV
jgi:hypothetical protein